MFHLKLQCLIKFGKHISTSVISACLIALSKFDVRGQGIYALGSRPISETVLQPCELRGPMAGQGDLRPLIAVTAANKHRRPGHRTRIRVSTYFTYFAIEAPYVVNTRIRGPSGFS